MAYVWRFGSAKAACDRCGFNFRLEQLRKEWTGLKVCAKCYDYRNPQDFVRGVPDRQAVPDPRPEPAPVFVIIGEGIAPVVQQVTIGNTNPVVGNTLTAEIVFSVPGDPVPTQSFQWYAGGVPVGTNSPNYLVTALDEGKVITVSGMATNTAGSDSGTSLATAAVLPAPSGSAGQSIGLLLALTKAA